MISFLTCGCVIALAAADPNAPNPMPPGKPIALVGGLVRTQGEPGDFVGTIVVQDGKIAALGRETDVPAGATRIDAAGHVITPGLIDADGALWLHPATSREGGRDGTLNVLDGVDPYADDWRDAAAHGVTAVCVQPFGSGSLGGGAAVLRVGAATSADELVLRHPAALQASLGAAPAPAPAAANPLAALFAQFGLPVPPAPTAAPHAANSLTRYAQYESLRSQLEAAKKYGESKPPRPDLAKELLLRVVRRELPLRLEVGHEDDLRNGLRLASESNLRVAFQGVHRVKALPDEALASKAALVIGPLAGVKPSAAVKQLALDGRRFAIGTGGDEPRITSWLRYHAAAAVADGFPRDRVLRALTRDAAELLGVGERLGNIAVGRTADLAVFAGDPLDPSVPVRMTICQGVVTYDRPGVETVPQSAASKPELPEQFPPGYVIKTSRLLQPTGEFAPGELFVERGRVTVHTAIDVAPTIDVGDAPITPGLVAAALPMPGDAEPDADAGHLRGADGLARDDANARAFRGGGFLTAVCMPASANVIAGVAGAVRTDDPTAATDCGIKFTLTAAARTAERFPISLVGQLQLVEERLTGRPPQSDLYLPPAVRAALLSDRDRALEGVRSRKSAAFFEAHSRAEVRAALRLAADHKLRGVLVQPKKADELTEAIRAAGVAVIFGPAVVSDPDKVRTGLVELGRAGVHVALGGGNAAELRTTAAWLTAGGLPRPTARRALVATPADAFGLPPGAGRLAPGDVADFVVWDGDPLDPGSRPLAVVAAGRRVREGS